MRAKTKSANAMLHAAQNILIANGAVLPENMLLPKKNRDVPKFAGIERELQSRLRLTYLSVFLQFGNYTPAEAAIRAGYKEEDVADPEYVTMLLKRALEAGLVAQVEIRPRELFATEVLNSWATVIHLRDHSDNHKVRLQAALELLDLAGYRRGEKAWEPQEVTEEEMSHWTKNELIAYFTSGGDRVPQRRKAGGLTVAGSEKPANDNEGIEDAQTLDEPKSGKGMLAG